ncbi:hypothetical protein ACHQM5_017838 [Ranunculus cassubicifolius]
MELAGNAARNDQMGTIIRSRHVHSSVKNDKELTEMLARMEIAACENESEDDDYEYDYDSSDDEDVDDIEITIKDVEECKKLPMWVGEVSIESSQWPLYEKLVKKFGEIVPPNLSKYKAGPTSVALVGLLKDVDEMMNITPETMTKDLITDWEEMVSAYTDMGLNLGWLRNHVQRCNLWLDKCPANLTGKVAAKQEELDVKRKEVSTLEKEMEELSAELTAAQGCQTQFGFSLLDDN